jgi:hypothetical protein
MNWPWFSRCYESQNDKLTCEFLYSGTSECTELLNIEDEHFFSNEIVDYMIGNQL